MRYSILWGRYLFNRHVRLECSKYSFLFGVVYEGERYSWCFYVGPFCIVVQDEQHLIDDEKGLDLGGLFVRFGSDAVEHCDGTD